MSSYGRATIVRPSLKELADIRRNQMCQELKQDIHSAINKIDNIGKAIVESQKRVEQLILKEKEKKKELEKINTDYEQLEEKFINSIDTVQSEELEKYQQRLREKDELIKKAKNEINRINLEINMKKEQGYILIRKSNEAIDNLKILNDELDGKLKPPLNEILELKEKGDFENSYHKALNLLEELKKNGELKSEKVVRLIELKEKIQSEFDSIIFYSDQVGDEFKNKIKEISKEIANRNLENALNLSLKTFKELKSIRVGKDSSRFKTAEEQLLLLDKEIKENPLFISKIITESDLIKVKTLLDLNKFSEFEEAMDNIRNKINNKFHKDIISRIKEIMINRSYEKITISEDDNNGTEIIGYKKREPLIFWIKRGGEIDFDFSDHALESDSECHREIKEFLLALRGELRNAGINIRISEIVKKCRKDKTKEEVQKTREAIEELGYKIIEVEEKHQGLEIKAKKVDGKAEKKLKQRERKKIHE